MERSSYYRIGQYSSRIESCSTQTALSWSRQAAVPPQGTPQISVNGAATAGNHPVPPALERDPHDSADGRLCYDHDAVLRSYFLTAAKEVIERKAPGADGASSRHIIEKLDGKTSSMTHQVTKDGKVIHQHQTHIGKHGTQRQFPDEWVEFPKVPGGVQ